jgi:hypothetical protein
VFCTFDCIIFGLWELGLVILTVLYLDLGSCVLFFRLYYIWTLGVLFGNFDFGIFGLQREPCFVLLTVLYWDFGSRFSYLCIMFGHRRELCFMLLTVLYLDTEAAVFCVLLE